VPTEEKAMNETLTSDAAAPRAELGGGERSQSSFRLPVWAWLSSWLVMWVGVSVVAHYVFHSVVNGWQIALAFFLAINILVCVWEISLYYRIGDIERWHREPRATSGRPSGSVYLARASFRELTTTRLWARIWSEYAFYDPSYADRRSFGFAADVGNGFVTLVPSLVFFFGMTVPVLPAVVLGLIGGFVFYQKLYCTSLYFFTFLFNRRYEGHRLAALLGVVGGTNGIWIVFPAIGLYVCIRLILEGRFDLLWS
jgi:hypothetical protein